VVTLLFPRFTNKYLQRIFIPRGKSPYIKINLDKFGSAFWNECDGKNDVHRIGEKMVSKFGKDIEPVYERLNIFIAQLRKNGYLDLKEKVE
jgi:hypothetical protein